MTTFDQGLIATCALIGFGGVWYAMSRVGKQRTAQDSNGPPPAWGAAAWYEVLEVPESADLETIKAAYREKIARFHPDKFASLGSDFQDVAAQRAKELNRAFDAAKRARS